MTPVAPERLPCVLCGSETAETRLALVEWTEPVEGEGWSHVPRCVDRPACRLRVEGPKPAGLGERWPLNDRTPAPELPEPVAAVEPPAADAEEEVSWMSR